MSSKSDVPREILDANKAAEQKLCIPSGVGRVGGTDLPDGVELEPLPGGRLVRRSSDLESVLCPHCGAEHVNLVKVVWPLDTHECDSCGKGFRFWTERTVTYYAEALEPDPDLVWEEFGRIEL